MAEEITLTRKELFNLANLGARYDSSKIKIFLSEFCKSDTYSVQDTILHVSIFTAKENPDDTVTIYISKPFKPYIFFKEDIEIMKKVKEKFLKLNPFGLLSCILSVRRFTHGRR